MGKRMAIVGLVALCAIALSAVAASGAFAGATAFTCVAGGGAGPNKFTDADCTTVNNTTGTFGHTAIAAGTPKKLKLKNLTNPVLEGKLFGASVKLEATGVECVFCEVENTTTSKGVMEVVGPATLLPGETLQFSGVRVVGLEAKCEVTQPASFGAITTQRLKFATTSSSGLTLEPEFGTVLAEFNIVAKSGQTCNVAGSNIKVTGKVPGTLSGAKLTVNVTKASGELQLEGEKASLKGEGTIEAGTGETFHPAALTTA